MVKRLKSVVAALKSSGLDVNEMACLGYSKQQSEKYNGKEGYTRDFFRA